MVSDRLWLATGVHAAALRDDLVLLDIHKDRYVCLPGAAPGLILGDRGSVTVADLCVRDVLLEEGLLRSEQPLDPRLPTTLPLRLGHTRDDPGAADLIQAGVVALAAACAFRGRTLAQLIADVRRTKTRIRHASGADPGALAAAFHSAMPWLPLEGLCLQRSFLLLRLLARRGIAADWVFGVRTWPFVAHCWVQIDDSVVGDRLAHVRAFTPILRV